MILLPKIIFLIGMPGSGKSTVGKLLAEKIGGNFVDLDEAIVEDQGKAIPTIFSELGEKSFREIESKVLEMVIEKDYDGPRVVATGGGTPCFSNNMSKMLMEGQVIYLYSSIESLEERILAQGLEKRPLFQEGEIRLKLKSLYEARRKRYEQAALTVETKKMSALELADSIQKYLYSGTQNL